MLPAAAPGEEGFLSSVDQRARGEERDPLPDATKRDEAEPWGPEGEPAPLSLSAAPEGVCHSPLARGDSLTALPPSRLKPLPSSPAPALADLSCLFSASRAAYLARSSLNSASAAAPPPLGSSRAAACSDAAPLPESLLLMMLHKNSRAQSTGSQGSSELHASSTRFQHFLGCCPAALTGLLLASRNGPRPCLWGLPAGYTSGVPALELLLEELVALHDLLQLRLQSLNAVSTGAGASCPPGSVLQPPSAQEGR